MTWLPIRTLNESSNWRWASGIRVAGDARLECRARVQRTQTARIDPLRARQPSPLPDGQSTQAQSPRRHSRLARLHLPARVAPARRDVVQLAAAGGAF